jgi:hypothetical protein
MRALPFLRSSRPAVAPHVAAAAPRTRTMPPRLRAVLGLLPALLPALLFLPVVLAPPLNHDVAAVLSFSQRWLGGEHLYSDLIDVNPPLVFVISLLPAAIAALLPVDATVALQACVLALGLFCWRLSWIARDRAAEGAVTRALLDALPLMVLLSAGYDFGQREHLMAIGVLPYVIGAARRAEGERPRGQIAAAIVAGVAIALKPHFLAVPALVELVVLAGRWRAPGRGGLGAALRASLRDAVPWTMAGVWLVYAASLPLVFPDYLNTVVPMVWDYYLVLGGLTFWEVLLVPRLAVALCLLVPCLLLALRGRATLPRLLGAAALGALASAVAQHKGWSYHVLPIALFACALAALLAAGFLDRVALPARPRPAALAGVLLALMGLYAISNNEAPWKEIDYADSEAAGLTALLKHDAAGERVLVLSPGIYPIYPALNDAGARMTLRTMNMWLLQGAYADCLPDGRRYREVWEMGRAEFFVYRTVAEDFARAPPAAVLVDRNPGIPWCGEEFDFLAYFTRHPLFAEVWSHYQLAAEWDRYRLYTRKD